MSRRNEQGFHTPPFMKDRTWSAGALTLPAIAVLMLAVAGPLCAADVFTEVSVETNGFPPVPGTGGSASSTTGLSQVIVNAANLARSDASLGGPLAPFAVLKVEARTNRNPSDPYSAAVLARARVTDNWSVTVGGCVACWSSVLNVQTMLTVHGLLSPTLPGGDVRLDYETGLNFFDPTTHQFLFNVAGLSEMHLFISESGSIQASVCTYTGGCTPVAVTTLALANTISIPVPLPSSAALLAAGIDISDLGSRYDVELSESSSLRAEMDPVTGESGWIDFFNTVNVGLQANEPGIEQGWASQSGRSLITAGPLAHAGPDQPADEGAVVTLDGSSSTGSDLSFAWSQIAGLAVSLSNPTSATPSFSAPLLPGGTGGSQTLTFQLTVTSGGTSGTDTDTVDVTVHNLNHAPQADAGADQTVSEVSLVTLSGAHSFDPDGDPLIYTWAQMAGPPVALDGTSSPQSSFQAPLVGAGGATLEFQLTVSDGLASASAAVEVHVENVNHAPIADAGPDQTAVELALVTLDGRQSHDPDGDALTYAWTQTAGPAITLAGADTARPSFVAPQVGAGGAVLRFGLVADDRLGGSSEDEVAVRVSDLGSPPTCDAARAAAPALWPPNHKLVPVAIAGVSAPTPGGVRVTIAGVTQDEPVDGLGDGDTAPDAVMLPAQSPAGDVVLLRAERHGPGNGRVYRIRFSAMDADGRSCEGAVEVGVPHSGSSGPARDDGQQYDSTQRP